MSQAPRQARSANLTGWKEISSYLEVSPRTAQLWEKKYQLPVRRIGGSRGTVHVSIVELEAWRRRRTESADDAQPVHRIQPADPAPPPPAAETIAAVPTNTEPRRPGRRRLLAALSAAAATALGWRLFPQATTDVPPPDRSIPLDQIIACPAWLSLSPDGKRAALIGLLERSDWRGLHVVDLSSGRLDTLIRDDVRASPVAWSPDGRRIAYLAADKTLCTTPADGGTPERVVAIPATEVRGVDWSEDGRNILVSALSAGALEVDLATSSITPLLSHPHVEAAHYVRFEGKEAILLHSQDGNPEGYISASPQTSIAVLSPATGMLQELFSVAHLQLATPYHPDGYVLHCAGRWEEHRVVATSVRPPRRGAKRDPVVIAKSAHAASINRGGQVAVLGGGASSSDVVWLDRHGRRLGRLGTHPFFLPRSIRISPDGERAVVFATDGIDTGFWLLDRHGRRLLIRYGYRNFGASAWSRDGSMTAHLIPGGDGGQVEILDVDEPSERRSIPADNFCPDDWAADGKTLLGSKPVEGFGRLPWRLSVDGSGPGQAVFRAPGDHWDVRWNPDETLLCYGRVLDGERHVFVRRSDAPPNDIGVMLAEGRQPRWVKNGAELIYERDGVLYAVPVALEGGRIVVGEPDQERFRLPKWTTKRMYDVAPDGERILAGHPSSEDPEPYRIDLWAKLELP